jgi:hypothetical protein
MPKKSQINEYSDYGFWFQLLLFPASSFEVSSSLHRLGFWSHYNIFENNQYTPCDFEDNTTCDDDKRLP